MDLKEAIAGTATGAHGLAVNVVTAEIINRNSNKSE
jgi:hypothetical protein